MTDETRDLTRQIDRRSRWKTAGSLVVAFVAFAALAFSAMQWVTRAEEQEQRADQEQQRADQEEGRAAEAMTVAEQLCGQVRTLGGVCVVDPADLRGDTGPPGPPPTDEQVQEAVNLFLLRNPPQPGRAPTMQEIADAVTLQLVANPPQRGPGPTPEQIAGAVATFLLENPPPPGQPGQDGEDGAPGADSTVPGPPGEPPLSWTFTTQDALGQPTTHRCERVDEFDPEAPRYECTEQDESEGP